MRGVCVGGQSVEMSSICTEGSVLGGGLSILRGGQCLERCLY